MMQEEVAYRRVVFPSIRSQSFLATRHQVEGEQLYMLAPVAGQAPIAGHGPIAGHEPL